MWNDNIEDYSKRVWEGFIWTGKRNSNLSMIVGKITDQLNRAVLSTLTFVFFRAIIVW